MLTEQLSTNDDLVESLDTEPVFDYLLQHGVLNTELVDGICNEETKLGRNSALLQHLDDNGNTAKALFINALRQSGQHKLASTIDTSQRIKPVYGTGYWDKPRHKGEVKIKICIKALKLLVPKTDSPTKPRNCVASGTPQRLHKSYENMLMLDNGGGDFNRSVKIVEYAYDREDEEDLPVKKSCWCMCFPLLCRPKRKKYEKGIEKKKNKEKLKPKDSKKLKSNPECRQKLDFRDKSPEPRKPQSSNNERQGRSNANPHGETTLSSSAYDQRRNSGSPRKELQTDIVVYKNNRNDSRTSRNVRDKENVTPVIMQYDTGTETVELRRPLENSPYRTYTKQTHRRNNTNNNGTRSSVEMCEKWKSSGKIFEEKLSEFCALFELQAMQNAVTKYFEQDRGTLFFQTGNDDTSVFICNICMSRKQVEALKKDYESGTMTGDLEKIILASDMKVQLDVQGMEISTVIDDDQFEMAMEELS